MSETEPVRAGVAARAAARRRNRWLAVGALAVAGGAFFFITFSGVGQNLVYYWGPSELRAAGGQAVGATIRLGGLVAEGSVVRGEGASAVEFDVIDRQGAKVHVKSRGVPPQMFREGIGVVVEGTLAREGHFAGNRIMVSHGNKYRSPGEHDQVDVQKLIRSTEGLDDKGGSAR